MRTPRPIATALVSAVGVIATAALVAGCSSSGNDQKRSSTPSGSSKSTAPTSKAAAKPTITQNPVPTAPANNVTKRKQVSLSKCGEVAGGWSASGTAKNPSTSAAASYTITVFFTTNGATVLDFARTTVKVAPGKSATWTAQKKFAATKPTLCVMTGVA